VIKEEKFANGFDKGRNKEGIMDSGGGQVNIG